MWVPNRLYRYLHVFITLYELVDFLENMRSGEFDKFAS